MSKNTKMNIDKKNRKKKRRTVYQLIVLLLISFLLIRSWNDFKQYQPTDSKDLSNTTDFLALSYFGVDWKGSALTLSKEAVREQLAYLKQQGYVSISSDDILRFYQDNQPLPKKAFYLSFEDGRNDSSLFVDPLLKRFNFQATMLTYADRIEDQAHHFLQPKELLRMKKSGYWELGSNGYRLSYINVVNDQREFIGQVNQEDVTDTTTLAYYNHYLMDYLRDEKMLPIETKHEMEQRIQKDYQLMKEVYTEALGEVPQVYMIMHANTMYQSMSQYVEAANEKEMKQLFALHFNRDQLAINTKKDSIYNLTRLQVAPSWSMNHWIARLNQQNPSPLPYVVGDEDKASAWESSQGVAQFNDEKIVLTALQNKEADWVWKEKLNPDDFLIETRLQGGVSGQQGIRLKGKKQEVIEVRIENDTLTLTEQIGERSVQKVQHELPSIDWTTDEVAFQKAKKYSQSETLEEVQSLTNLYPEGVTGDRFLSIQKTEQGLEISVDEQHWLMPTKESYDKLSLIAAPATQVVAHERQADRMIYDGIFKEITISTHQGVSWSMKEQGIERVINQSKKLWNGIIQRAVEWL